MTSFDVVLLGKLLPGADQGRAVAALARATGLAPEKAAALLTSGQPKLAKRGVSQDAGKMMVQKFQSLGIAAALRPTNGAKAAAPAAPTPKPVPKPVPKPMPKPAKPAPKAVAPAVKPAPAVPAESSGPAGQVFELELESAGASFQTGPAKQDMELAPKSPARPVEAAEAKEKAARRAEAIKKREAELAEVAAQKAEEKAEEEHNPYAPPKASLTRNLTSGTWRLDPAEVPVMNGLSWFREAWDIFLAEPAPYLKWAGMLLALMLVLTTILPLLVNVGSASGIALFLIGPGMAGMLCARAHLQNTGNETPLAIKGKHPGQPMLLRRLLNVGALCALYQLVLGTPLLLVAGVLTQGNAAHFGRILLAVLAGVILTYPLYLVAMFAPSLVALTNDSAMASIKRAIRAGLASKGALLVNALSMGFLVMFFFALAVILGMILGSPVVTGALVSVFFGGFWLIFVLVSYVATNDLFAGDDA